LRTPPVGAREWHLLDNFFTGAHTNIEHLLDNKHFELIRYYVTLPIYLEIDEIYNLACPASPIHYQHDPVQTTKTSVHCAINMLGFAKRVKAKIRQASTRRFTATPTCIRRPRTIGARSSDQAALLLR
jgi:UDP-glucuronate decarboxylase